MVQSLWKIVQQFLKKLNVHSPYHPATAFLDIYPRMKTMSTQKILYTIVHRLAAIAKNWKWPKCPIIGEWLTEHGTSMVAQWSRCDYKGVTQRDLCGDRTVMYLDCGDSDTNLPMW